MKLYLKHAIFVTCVAFLSVTNMVLMQLSGRHAVTYKGTRMMSRPSNASAPAVSSVDFDLTVYTVCPYFIQNTEMIKNEFYGIPEHQLNTTLILSKRNKNKAASTRRFSKNHPDKRNAIKNRLKNRKALKSQLQRKLETVGDKEEEGRGRFAEHYPDLVRKSGRCELQTNHTNQRSPARVIVFQRDEGRRLEDFITHYLQVLDYQSIVVIDHQLDDNIKQEIHTNTATMLQKYGRLGVHIWKCTGPWREKAKMWSSVTLAHGKSSDFVFPLDVDEYLAVMTQKQQQGQPTLLRWNRDAFLQELARLHEGDYLGKPFKMRPVKIYPADCPDYYPHLNNSKRSNTTSPSSFLLSSQQQQQKYHKAEKCWVQFQQIDNTELPHCMAKSFARGEEFHHTDAGNHFGRTRCFSNIELRNCLKLGVDNVYDVTNNIAMVHLQAASFSAWYGHILRGAADYGYNKPDVNCKSVPAGIHYCKGFQQLSKLNFDVWKMRKLYNKEKCPNPDRAPDDDWDDFSYRPIMENMTGFLCGQT